MSKRKSTPIILAAWAEHCSGPGWRNDLIWVLERAPDSGELTVRGIQPEDQTPEMRALFNTSSACMVDMVRHVKGAKEAKRG